MVIYYFCYTKDKNFVFCFYNIQHDHNQHLNKPQYQEEDNFDLKGIIIKIISYWYLFVIGVIIALIAGFLYNRYTPKVYQVSASVFIKEDKVWIIEIGGRTGATCIPELISTYKGYDWYEKIIRAALGESVDFTSEKEIPCMAKLLFSHKDGIIKHIDQKVVQTLLEKGVIVQLDYGIGKTIETMKNATDRIGHVIMSGDDESVLDEYLAMLRGAIELEENSSKLEM